uniref:Uncharacterized protein n=1 Tax=viral metagenome TaxID=1070528 RepID=A0A6C0CD60_9ZZZZ
MDVKIIDKGTQLFKTVSYECESIKSYMDIKPTKPCYTNKMIWLSEDRERALSYGSDLKIFMVKNDLNLLNLTNDNIPNFLNDKIDDEYPEINSTILRVISRDSLNLREQTINLYGLLTGAPPFSVNVQLHILKTVRDNIKGYGDIFRYDGNTIGQIMITPDKKEFANVVDEYISIGDSLDEEQLKLTNQRLSIYGLDQLLLKLMCLNEQVNHNDVHGWYVPRGSQTVWIEIVKGQQVSDMGEIALFDCRNLVECSIKGSIKKKTKRKNKSKPKKSKSKRKSKPKKSKPKKSKPKSKGSKTKYMLN